MSINFQIKGVAQTIRNLKVTSRKTDRAINRVMPRIGLFMEAEIKESVAGHRAERTSVDTGRFLNSITSSHIHKGTVISDGVKYGKHLEYGTSKLPARRHFANSMSRNRLKIKGFLEKEVKKAVK